jgi:glycosyltransferase involved in cell wall biosynthesis
LRPAVAALGPFTARVETVRWGVDPSRYRVEAPEVDTLRQRLGVSPEDAVILSPRILAPLYNIELLLEALPLVLARSPHALLLLTEYNAAPGYRGHLEAQIAALGLGDRVRFVGALPASEMPALYALSRAVAMVPASDGLPQSLFEAMAAGTPVVLGRLPGYAEVVRDGETALFCDFTPGSLAQAILRLLREDALRSTLATAARGRVAECAFLPGEVARVEALYRELKTNSRPRTKAGRGLDALGLFLR